MTSRVSALPHAQPLRVCVLDDDREVTDLLRLLLESRGLRCHVAYDGVEGLACIRSLVPDLVVVDIRLPLKNGYEVLMELKQDPRYAGIPVLVLTSVTAGTGRSDREWEEKLGVAGFLSKPLEPLALLPKVKELLGLREPAEANATSQGGWA